MAKEPKSISLNNSNSHEPVSHYDVTLDSKVDLQHVLTDPGQNKPAMKGFDPKFSDFVDYIIKITHEIWEERGIGRLYEYYGTNMKIHTSSGDIYGRDKVIEGTIQSLASFPNRRLYGDEVVWGGNENDGLYSSHRLTHEGNNWGATSYGPATGKRINYRAIADCLVKENVIVEEWLVRDELSLITQLGFDAWEMAKRFAAKEDTQTRQLIVPSEPDRLQGQLPPTPPAPFDSAEFDVEQLVKTSIHEIWNWRLLNKVSDYYADGYICESASNRRFYGRNQYINYILSLMSPFPDLAIGVDHFCSLQESENSYRTATRWTMRGTHTGPGIYGEPSGKPITIMGVTHHLIQDGKFVHEWTLFDEFALLKQIAPLD